MTPVPAGLPDDPRRARRTASRRIALASSTALGIVLAATSCIHRPPSAVAGSREPGAESRERRQLSAPTLSATTVTPPGYHNETSIAIDPVRSGSVLAAYQIPASVLRTTDGGAHWSGGALPGVRQFELAGDPSVYFDADGHAYALYIAFDRPEDYDTLGKAAHRNGIWINRSDDGGATWRPTAAAIDSQPERAGVPFEDKPMMAIDRSSDPARRGRLYVAWTEFRRHETVILFSRSTDGGASWSPPITISDAAGSPKDTTGADEGTDLVVAPDGTVYVVWSDSTGILLDRSTDGGVTFGPDRRIATAASPIIFGVPSVQRANGYPSLEIDPRTGRLYVSWVDRRLGPAAPFLITSDDGGATWTAPRPIVAASSGTLPDRDDRFFSWMSVDPATGLVALGWYRALGADSLRYELAWSADGGRSFDVRPWSTRPFVSRGEFLGDYTGVDARDGTVYAAWTEASPDSTRPVAGRQHGSWVVVGKASFR